jgi:putative hydrolase of HD superfamily
MLEDDIKGALDFLRSAEKLKDVLRSGYTSGGRPESTPEHTWRLCLMVIVFANALGDIDIAKLLKICIVHDLGEALSGDIPPWRRPRTAARRPGKGPTWYC